MEDIIFHFIESLSFKMAFGKSSKNVLHLLCKAVSILSQLNIPLIFVDEEGRKLRLYLNIIFFTLYVFYYFF